MKYLSRLLGLGMTVTVACAGVELPSPDLSPQDLSPQELSPQELSPQEIAAIDLSDARNDQGWAAPVSTGIGHLATDPTRKAQLDVLVAKLALWAPAHDADPATRVGALLNAMALVDLGRGACEGEFAWTILDRLQHDPERAAILQATARLAARRDSYTPVNSLLPLEITTTQTTERVHARMALYARKLLGRLLGSLPGSLPGSQPGSLPGSQPSASP